MMVPLFAIALAFAPAVYAQWKTPWSYAGARGPAHWADLDPEYAACNGRQQSPIDIRETRKEDLPALRFEYEDYPLQYLVNNGYTIRVNYHPPVGALVVGNERYQLTQFHFHRPSEETIHGRQFDMVVHLMHESAGHKVAGVAVMLQVGKANAALEQIWRHMPAAAGKEQEVPGVAVNPAAFLPHDLSYYTYTGSLTAPPCDEGVAWFVLKTPVDVSAEQIARFAGLYPHDVRPVQPLNGRIVKESR